MSSAHIIIIARNDKTGELEVPLGDTTLYDVGGSEHTLELACKNYGPDWTLSLYRPFGDKLGGTAVPVDRVEQTVRHVENHPSFTVGADFGKEPDKTVTAFINPRELSRNFTPDSVVKWPDAPTGELRYFNGALQQRWWVDDQGWKLEWRDVPQLVATSLSGHD